jgi:hypothetical protein
LKSRDKLGRGLLGVGEPVREGRQKINRGRAEKRKEGSHTGLLLTYRRKQQ